MTNGIAATARAAAVAGLGLCLVATAPMLASAASNPRPNDDWSAVTARLHAGFSAPLFLHELAENVGYINQSAFFPFILGMTGEHGDRGEDDEAIYKQALEVTSKHGLIQHDTQRALLSFGLGLRAKAPAVEAQYSYYRDEVLGWQRGLLRKATAADPNANEQFDTGCRTWVQWKDRQACGIDEFKKIVETDSFYGDTYLEEPRIRPSKLELDHIFCNPAGGGERVVMYTDGDGIGEFHEYLSHLCEERGITYVLRFIPPAGHNNARRDLYLSGYGAEMKLKSTEYKVDDDRLVKGNGDQARKFVSDARAQRGLREQNIFNPTEEPAIRSLKPSKLSRLGIQAAQLILEAGHGNRTSMVVDNSLDMLAALSQDFPKYAHYIARTAVDPKYSKALKTLEEPSVADALFINGYRIAAHDVDPFNLFERIVAETKVAAELQGLGMNATQAQQIMTAPTPPVTPPGRAGDLVVAGEVFDVRDASEGGGIVMWLNDLERDSRYKSWPASLETLKQQYYGQLPRVRRNVAHVLFALDFSSPAGLDVFASVSNLVKNGFMMRVGFVPLVDRRDQNSAANAMARLYHYLHARHGLKTAVEFLTSVHEQVVKRRKAARDPRQLLAAVKAQFEQWAASNPQKDGDNVLEWSEIVRASDDDHDSDEFKDFIRRAGQFKRRLGLYTDHFSELGVTFINGRPVQMEGYFMGNLVDLYGQVCIEVAQLYQEHKITNETNIYDLLLDQPGVMRSRNPIVYPSETAPERFIDMCPIRRLIPPHMYFAPTSADQPLISLHVVGDLSTAAGRTAALNALVAASSRNDTRVAILHAESGEKSAKDGSAEEASGGLHVATLYQLLNRGSKFDRGVAIDLAISYLENPDNPTQRYLDHSGRPAKEAGRLAAELARLISEIGEDELEAATLFHRQAVKALRAAGAVVKPGAQTVVCNGRVLPPITHDNYFDQNAFVELIELELNPRIRNFNRVLRRAASDLAALEQYPDIVLCAASVVESATHSHQPHGLFKYQWGTQRVDVRKMLSGAEALRFTAGTDAQSASVHIQSVIDPLSKTAQKWAPILKALSELAGVAVEVWCRPAKKYTELPLTRFYRYAIGPRAEFEAGRLVMPTIIFDYLPKDPLYTLDLDVPGPWLVMATESVHDLDNIRLDQLAASGKSISAVYELRHILIEGHCLDSTLHSPPRGLEVQLGTSASPNITDTIVMANYGYLQLQANPGVWRFSIRPGLSLDLYRIHSVSQDSFDYESSVGDVGSADLTVGSFRGIVPFILVEKRPGKETESLLALGGGAAGQRTAVREQTAVGTPGLWARVKSLLGLPDSTGGDVGAKRSQLNIFAVASGHLYERLMSIMILSVLKHTESHVRFWLIENFLSPSFKEFVPRMAEHYGFEFEFVTYKWPHWLHAETEKQRTIWGYKILFLDVLFPLDLDRVIFVDADQIVRADLQELNDMDLHGAPYGYVPFCDDRAEIEGYRFWKTGWWKSHLKGKPYHISALYVVDLRQFRRMAAGDLLRGQYQALSSDEGSLANLDQDLPNNMQHGVPIYSLPQEWLWCETWCSDDTLKKAKTIDLCNNPMTKEPKLERARRLLPEWEVYDREIAEFSRRLGSEGSDDTEGAGYQHSITDTDTTRDEL